MSLKRDKREMEKEREQLAHLKIHTSRGATWKDIAEILKFAIDESKAIREKLRRRVNSWIASRYGTGPDKQVFSVYSEALGEWVYKSLDYMTDGERAQVRTKLEADRVRATDRVVRIDTFFAYMDMLARQQLIFTDEDLPAGSDALTITTDKPAEAVFEDKVEEVKEQIASEKKQKAKRRGKTA